MVVRCEVAGARCGAEIEGWGQRRRLYQRRRRSVPYRSFRTNKEPLKFDNILGVRLAVSTEEVEASVAILIRRGWITQNVGGYGYGVEEPVVITDAGGSMGRVEEIVPVEEEGNSVGVKDGSESVGVMVGRGRVGCDIDRVWGGGGV